MGKKIFIAIAACMILSLFQTAAQQEDGFESGGESFRRKGFIGISGGYGYLLKPLPDYSRITTYYPYSQYAPLAGLHFGYLFTRNIGLASKLSYDGYDGSGIYVGPLLSAALDRKGLFEANFQPMAGVSYEGNLFFDIGASLHYSISRNFSISANIDYYPKIIKRQNYFHIAGESLPTRESPAVALSIGLNYRFGGNFENRQPKVKTAAAPEYRERPQRQTPRSSEPTLARAERPAREPAPVREPRPVREPAPAREPRPAREPAREPKPAREPAPAREPRPAREPAPAREPRPAPQRREPANARAERPAPRAANNVPTGGDLSPDIAWRIDDGTLYLSGKGVVPTTMFGQKSAWDRSRSLFSAVVIEEGITDVGKLIFNGYSNISSLTIAKSVRTLDLNSFSACKNLVLVETKSAVPPDINYGVFYGTKTANARLVVPKGASEAYRADPLWQQFGRIVESDSPDDSEYDFDATLSEPCIISLKRTSNFVGAARKIEVFLNGESQKPLSNGATIRMTTNRQKNEIFLRQGKMAIALRRFDAKEGGDMYIEFSYFNGTMKIMDEERSAESAAPTGEVRRPRQTDTETTPNPEARQRAERPASPRAGQNAVDPRTAKRDAAYFDRTMRSNNSQERERYVGMIENEELLCKIATRYGNTDFRTGAAAVKKIQDTDLLYKIALESKALRELAAEKIHGEEMLYQIAEKSISDKDFKLYRKITSEITDQKLLSQMVKYLNDNKAALPQSESTSDFVALIDKISDMDILKELALQTTLTEDIRANALKKIDDPAFLYELAVNDKNHAVSNAAFDRLDEAMLQKCIADTVPANLKQKALNKITDQEFLYKVMNDTLQFAEQLRKNAFERIKDRDLLIKIVQENANWDIRKSAFNKLDTAGLEAVAEGKFKDKSFAVAAKIILKKTDWSKEFANKSTAYLGQVIGAAALVNSPKPESTDVVAACHKYIRQGDASRIPELIYLLDNYGNVSLAEDYMNCGQKTLSDAGCSWGNRHGYSCTTGYGSSRVQWGSGR